MNPKLKEKLMESLTAVLPITLIVLALSVVLVPMDVGTAVMFTVGAVLLVFGMGLFQLGAEMAMSPLGEGIGVQMERVKKIPVIVAIAFVMGVIITIAEPDLQVLAQQVPSIPNKVLIYSIAVGVGAFLALAVVRILKRISLSKLLLALYGLLAVVSVFVSESFLAVAYDSGGVTTGPITVPFIMAMGVGVSAIRSDKHSANDSFGLVALCSIGPILAVLILSLIFRPDGGSYTPVVIPEIGDSAALWQLFFVAFPTYFKEIAVSLLPIAAFFGVFNLVSLRLERKQLIRIGVGLAYTYLGLVIFLTGVNVGFMPAGNYLGSVIAGLSCNWIIIPIGMLIGYFIVMAEPAVYVLMRQVEELTDGAIPGSAMKHSLSIGVAVSVGLAMIRVLTGISIFYLLVPGYAVAIALSFFVPKLFTAIAFDSGGVASGPMATTFLLPFAMGACSAVGGNIVTDAFGVVAMVAMTPLITIQGLGLLYRLRTRRGAAESVPAVSGDAFAALDDLAIIDL